MKAVFGMVVALVCLGFMVSDASAFFIRRAVVVRPAAVVVRPAPVVVRPAAVVVRPAPVIVDSNPNPVVINPAPVIVNPRGNLRIVTDVNGVKRLVVVP